MTQNIWSSTYIEELPAKQSLVLLKTANRISAFHMSSLLLTRD